MRTHITEALDISVQTAGNSKNATAVNSSAVISGKEAAGGETALVSATNARITQNAVLISITTMLQKPMKNTYTLLVIHEKA